MRFSEDRLPPLWVERFDTYYGADLTPHDLYLEELEDRPSQVPLLPHGTTGLRALPQNEELS